MTPKKVAQVSSFYTLKRKKQQICEELIRQGSLGLG